LALAYRVVPIRLKPIKWVLAQNVERNIAYTAGHESYTMNPKVKGRESLAYAFLKAEGAGMPG
jgi:hypothetical protein